jgi:hypothetical protein
VGLAGRLFRHGLGLRQGKKGALQWDSLVDYSVMAWGYVKVRKGDAGMCVLTSKRARLWSGCACSARLFFNRLIKL